MRRVLMIMAAAGFLAAAAPAQAALVNEAPASSWQTDGKVNAIVVANGKIYIGGSFTHVRAPGAPSGGAVRNHLAALDLHTGALQAVEPRRERHRERARGQAERQDDLRRRALHEGARGHAAPCRRGLGHRQHGAAVEGQHQRQGRRHQGDQEPRSTSAARSPCSRARRATGWAPCRPPRPPRWSTGSPTPAPRSTRFSSRRPASASTSAVPSTT